MYHGLFEGFFHCKLFSCLFIAWHCYRDLLRQWQALGSKNLNSKNACYLRSQKLRVLISILASFELFDVVPCTSFPDNSFSLGSILVSLYTSDILSAVRSRKSLSCMYVKPPFLQLILRLILKLLPQGQDGGRLHVFPAISESY